MKIKFLVNRFIPLNPFKYGSFNLFIYTNQLKPEADNIANKDLYLPRFSTQIPTIPNAKNRLNP